MKPDIYISTDAEADGPIPGVYSMQSFGMCVTTAPDTKFFYSEGLKPISDLFVPEAAAVGGFDREILKADGRDPAEVMAKCAAWLDEVTDHGKAGKPVFVGFNATFDWMFLAYYFHRFLGRNPLGISGLDIKAFYMGLLRKQRWSDTAKRNIEKQFMSKRPHTHNALDDAREQADLFENLRKFAGATTLDNS
jgi:DNA polymerase III epsilon subunit-like protein